jgi:hypothetical protein
MALPQLFGSSWEEFVSNWCLGNPPIDDREAVERALAAFVRIWPAKAASLVSGPNRGLAVISPAIETGAILMACEDLDGFPNVLRRLKTGERSARSELVFASRIVKGGYRPTLEPPLGSGLLDLLIPTTEGNVYCEVIAPEMSDAIQEMTSAASALALMLRDENVGRRVEVLLTVDIDETVAKRVAESVREHSDSDETWEIEDLAVVSKRLTGDDANVGPTIQAGQSIAVIGAAQTSLRDGLRTAGIARVPVTDARAKRLLYAESHHFSQCEMNILVMDMTKVVAGVKAWRPLIERCFQPDRNRRFGAVVLFTSGFTVEKMSPVQQWVVLRNQHAYKSLPNELLQKIEVPQSE